MSLGKWKFVDIDIGGRMEIHRTLPLRCDYCLQKTKHKTYDKQNMGLCPKCNYISILIGRRVYVAIKARLEETYRGIYYKSR